MSSLAEVLAWRFPGVEGIRTDGSKITGWPAGQGAQPAQSAIDQFTIDFQAVEADVKAENEFGNEFEVDRIKRLPVEVNFDQENRIRVLEGRAALPDNAAGRAQYKTALLNLLKTL